MNIHLINQILKTVGGHGHVHQNYSKVYKFTLMSGSSCLKYLETHHNWTISRWKGYDENHRRYTDPNSTDIHYEIIDWCSKNCLGETAFAVLSPEWAFEEETDAMAFKLRWL